MDIAIGIYLCVGLYFLVRWYGPYRRQGTRTLGDRVKFALFTLLGWPLGLYWNWRRQISGPR